MNAYLYLSANPTTNLDFEGLAYQRCVQTNTRCTSSNSFWVWTGVFPFRVTICLQRKCWWRCYCGGQNECPKRPCMDKNCLKDHGVEEFRTFGPDPTKPLGAAPRCSDEIDNVIVSGNCEGSPPIL
jgi:hypothetical protein